MIPITQTTTAWITPSSVVGPQDLIEAEAGVLGRLFYSNADMTAAGWTRVGRATITLEPVDTNTLVSNKLVALRAQATEIKAEAQAKVTAIEEQISNLLAISYDGGAQ